MGILHLGLPDNMLGRVEAEMVADMLSLNPLLLTLNLANNRLDHHCAVLIGRALTCNDHLLRLDLSGNVLGDLGVLQLLKPLIRQRNEINSEVANLGTGSPGDDADELDEATETIGDGSARSACRDIEIKNGDPRDLRAAKSQLNDLRHKLNKMNRRRKKPLGLPCSLLALDITQNRTTFEAYRPVWTLLAVNPSLALAFDTPDQVRN